MKVDYSLIDLKRNEGVSSLPWSTALGLLFELCFCTLAIEIDPNSGFLFLALLHGVITVPAFWFL